MIGGCVMGRCRWLRMGRWEKREDGKWNDGMDTWDEWEASHMRGDGDSVRCECWVTCGESGRVGGSGLGSIRATYRFIPYESPPHRGWMAGMGLSGQIYKKIRTRNVTPKSRVTFITSITFLLFLSGKRRLYELKSYRTGPPTIQWYTSRCKQFRRELLLRYRNGINTLVGP